MTAQKRDADRSRIRRRVFDPALWFAAFPALYLALAMAAPLLASLGAVGPAQALFSLFSGLCHQWPSRSLMILGHPMAICARCFALAGGLVVGALIPQARTAWVRSWMMLGAQVPMALDGLTQLLALRESTTLLRLSTGALAGFMASLWIVARLEEACREIFPEARST